MSDRVPTYANAYSFFFHRSSLPWTRMLPHTLMSHSLPSTIRLISRIEPAIIQLAFLARPSYDLADHAVTPAPTNAIEQIHSRIQNSKTQKLDQQQCTSVHSLHYGSGRPTQRIHLMECRSLAEFCVTTI